MTAGAGRFRTILAIALAAHWIAMAVATHLPADALPDVPGTDKSKHFIGYAVLALLLAIVLKLRGFGRFGAALAAVAICAAYGAVDELTQPWFGRFCELGDWVADLVGSLVGAMISLAVPVSNQPMQRGGARHRTFRRKTLP